MPLNEMRNLANGQQSCKIFVKLLFRWYGSVYKLIWMDMLISVAAYTVLNVVYRYATPEYLQGKFEAIVLRVGSKLEFLPVTLVLGFFVTHIMERRQAATDSMPRFDNFAMSVTNALRGEKNLALRKQLVRYAKAAHVIIMVRFSPQLSKRFPDVKSLASENEGLITESENISFQAISDRNPENGTGDNQSCQGNPCCIDIGLLCEANSSKINSRLYWVPIVWAANLVSDNAAAFEDTQEKSSQKGLIDELYKIKADCAKMLKYETNVIPLAYIQVVTLAVYLHCFFAIVGGQLLDSSKNIEGYETDFYVPLYTMLQNAFYIGWLRTAETMVNYFGEDDDNLDVAAFFDRQSEVANQIVADEGDLHSAADEQTQPHAKSRSSLGRADQVQDHTERSANSSLIAQSDGRTGPTTTGPTTTGPTTSIDDESVSDHDRDDSSESTTFIDDGCESYHDRDHSESIPLRKIPTPP